ncbi:MAG: Fe-S cluster assembly protein SufD [Bacteroidota bacterium]|nr:Fe-S cluster assembly protein SufD [Bacteroidota bacterium]MDE2957775.1 Fe-S cluster assembly protein SufD [Bacteroidota bacterium]
MKLSAKRNTFMVKYPEERIVAEFERQHAVNGTWLPHLREKALAAFKTSGFPTRRQESWKYTNIAPIVRRSYSTPDGGDADTKGAPDLDAHVLVLVNGRLQPDRSVLHGLPAQITATSLTDESHTGLIHAHLAQYASFAAEPFTALNTAFPGDGALIHVPADSVLEKPVHLIHVTTSNQAAMVQPRTLILAGPNAQAKIVQSMVTHAAAPVLINSVSEILVGANAHVEHLTVQSDGPQVSAIHHTSVYQHQSSRFYNGCFTFGGELTRNNLSILPDAEHCETLMHGLFVARDRSHIDNSTLVDHAKPNCYSSEYYKGILDDRATGVFNGKVLVRQNAQLTNAYQTNRSIVLSETARMFSKPALEIYADDVKCSHGATTGQLDKDGLFYLRARGINPEDARRLMLISFAGDIIEQVPIEGMREVLYGEVERMLQ